MAKVGAHVSAAGSVDLSIERAVHIGAQCTQIFISPPRQWLMSEYGEEKIAKYKSAVSSFGITPNFIHATYLINLAAQDPKHLEKSVNWLKYALKVSGCLGCSGVIIHIGSHKGAGFEAVFEQICRAIKQCLANSKSDLILENCAGSGGAIGCKFFELGKIIKAVKSPRLKVCLDTQHAFAAGYDLKTPATLDSVLAEFNEQIGLENLVVIHANDSKTALGSNVDRHENIGEGLIGKAGFANMINHPKLRDLPFILEVPGFTNTGPDKENIDILKSLIL